MVFCFSQLSWATNNWGSSTICHHRILLRASSKYFEVTDYLLLYFNHYFICMERDCMGNSISSLLQSPLSIPAPVFPSQHLPCSSYPSQPAPSVQPTQWPQLNVFTLEGECMSWDEVLELEAVGVDVLKSLPSHRCLVAVLHLASTAGWALVFTHQQVHIWGWSGWRTYIRNILTPTGIRGFQTLSLVHIHTHNSHIYTFSHTQTHTVNLGQLVLVKTVTLECFCLGRERRAFYCMTCLVDTRARLWAGPMWIFGVHYWFR